MIEILSNMVAFVFAGAMTLGILRYVDWYLARGKKKVEKAPPDAAPFRTPADPDADVRAKLAELEKQVSAARLSWSQLALVIFIGAVSNVLIAAPTKALLLPSETPAPLVTAASVSLPTVSTVVSVGVNGSLQRLDLTGELVFPRCERVEERHGGGQSISEGSALFNEDGTFAGVSLTSTEKNSDRVRVKVCVRGLAWLDNCYARVGEIAKYKANGSTQTVGRIASSVGGACWLDIENPALKMQRATSYRAAETAPDAGSQEE